MIVDDVKNKIVDILNENGINDIKQVDFDELELYGSFVLAQSLLDICIEFGIEKLEQENGK